MIVQSHHATATRLSTLLDGALSYDQITRFLNRNDFDLKNLWPYVKLKVCEQEKEGVPILTMLSKKNRDENPTGELTLLFSCQNIDVKDINLLTCLVRYENI